MTDRTYPFLEQFYQRAKGYLPAATAEWITAKAKASAGGKAYPANEPLTESEHGEAYMRVYNAVVPWAGRELAEKVAKEAMPPATRDAATLPYREAPEEPMDTYTEEDMEGLDDDIGALFVWTLMHPDRLIEVYGKDGKQPPDYVPAAKRTAWAALFNAVLRKYGDEGKAFAIANDRYAKKGDK